MTKLPASDRADIVNMLDSLKRGVLEELNAKFSFWDELPHILLGVFPMDAESKGVAEAALRKWDALSEVEHQQSHRVARRLLDPALGLEFPALFRCPRRINDPSELCESFLATSHFQEAVVQRGCV